MSFNPPQLGDFEGDEDGFQKGLGAYEQGYLAVGNCCKDGKNPYKEGTDEHYFWKEGYNDCLADIW